ncbi:MAG: RDD family protein, partial [Chloroflexota bacterium]
PPSPAPSGQPPSGMPSWTNNITARGTMSGPAGVTLADLPDRIIAFVIDAIILGIAGFIVSTVTLSVLGDNYAGVFGFAYRSHNIVSSLATALIMLGVSAAYFIGMWSRMGGATVGMRVMKLSVRDAMSGAPVNQAQAINRWLYVGAPFALSFLYVWGVIGWLVALAVFGYEIYLLMTTAQSPTRQGFHDMQAKTVVAKG